MLIKKIILPVAILATIPIVNAKNIPLSNITYYGPIEIIDPWLNGNVDVNNKEFSPFSFLENPINFKLGNIAKGDSIMILGSDSKQLHAISFPVYNDRYAEILPGLKGTKDYKILVDNKEIKGKSIKIKPGLHEVMMKFLTTEGTKDTIRVSLDSPQAENIFMTQQEKRPFTLDDVIYSEHFTDLKTSPSGKYAIIAISRNMPDNKTERRYKIISTSDGKTISFLTDNYKWLPSADILWKTNRGPDGKRNIVTIDPATFEESVMATNVPEGNFTIGPTGDYLIYFTSEEGPREDKDIYRVINPEDRQAGYRNRSGLALYNLNTGEYRPLSFGNKNVSLQDISADGTKLLISDMRNRFEKRPTTVFSLYELWLNDMKVDTLVFEDGFISGAKYSPDEKKVVISGSPESLGGVGKNVPAGRIPSMTDGQIFIMDISTREIDPITKNFNPSVGNYTWHKPTGNIYFTAEDKDLKPLFEYNPLTKKFTKLNFGEDIINGYSLATNGFEIIVNGESVSNPDILYSANLKKGLHNLNKIDSSNPRMMEETLLAHVSDWDFINSRGDTINGRFYLPPNFDPDKKYPLIVNYYGGCSPTSKNFATRYPHHVYANNGYIVYVINPSGATGFGQEFSSRHVNTAGEGVAQDIIEGTQKFIEEHPYVNKEKVGCIGASYGGFMTQYLQTVSDIFAAAISHAGISDNTSYWGNGYWGYSYSEVSMAESYPWSNPDLYVKQSPLYNADKINTPILFLHGDVDNNVPPAESIQLFTALKLLGKDTALVEVKDQNHHIMDPEKRKKWQDTIFAWFAKYLQDDSTWWDELYPPTSL